MKVAAIALSLIAVAALLLAIRDMVLGSGNAQRGWVLRAIAVLAFVAAGILNAVAK
jgi:hypothetical protein